MDLSSLYAEPRNDQFICTCTDRRSNALADKQDLKMKIQLTVIEDLGIKLYGTLPPVLAELIANAWDADARGVDVTLHGGTIDKDSAIIVRDDGHGMSYGEINAHYLMVGRKRRESGTGARSEETKKGRLIMGRKGIGKLSVFGVAREVEITSVKGGKKTAFSMNLEEMIQQAKDNGTYRPKVMIADKDTGEADGTTVKLSCLKRKSKLDPVPIRKGIAKHFRIIGEGFEVVVNGEAVSPKDRLNMHDLIERRKYEAEDLYEGSNLGKDTPKWPIYGTISTSKNPLAADDRGLTIMARGKLIQRPTLFDIKEGNKFAYSYITGEINAEFFDEDSDLISTNRQSLIWEDPRGEALKKWGTKVLREVAEEFTRERRDNREKSIRNDPEFEPWIRDLKPRERTTIDKVIGFLTSNDSLDEEQRRSVMQYIRTSFRFQVFGEMVDSLSAESDPADMLAMFKEWDMIEAHEIRQIVKGRLQAIEKLEDLVKQNAREVNTMHEHLARYPWLIDPSRMRWEDEVTYSRLLREHFPDENLDEPDRRIDFLSVIGGDTIYVIEIKRAGYHAKDRDMKQLLDYVTFVKRKMGRDSGFTNVSGYMIVGEIPSDESIITMIGEAEPNRRYVKTYTALIAAARRWHSAFMENEADRHTADQK